MLEPELQQYLSRQHQKAVPVIIAGVLFVAGAVCCICIGGNIEPSLPIVLGVGGIIILAGAGRLRTTQRWASRADWLVRHTDAKNLQVSIEKNKAKVFLPTSTEPIILTVAILHHFSRQTDQTSADKGKTLEQEAQVRSDLFCYGVSIIETFNAKYWGVVSDSSLAPRQRLFGKSLKTPVDLVSGWQALPERVLIPTAAICVLVLTLDSTIIFTMSGQLIVLAVAVLLVLSFEKERLIGWVTLQRLRTSKSPSLDKANVMALAFAYFSQGAQREVDACNEVLLVTDYPPNSLAVTTNQYSSTLPKLTPFGFPARLTAFLAMLLIASLSAGFIDATYPGLERPFKTERYDETTDSEYELMAFDDPATRERANSEGDGKDLSVKKDAPAKSHTKNPGEAAIDHQTFFHDEFKGNRELHGGVNTMFSQEIDNFGCDLRGIEIIAKGPSVETGLLDKPRALFSYMEGGLDKEHETAIWLQRKSDGYWWGRSTSFALPNCNKQLIVLPLSYVKLRFYVDAIKQGKGNLEVTVQPLTKPAIMDLKFRQTVSVDMTNRDVDDPSEWPDSQTSIASELTKQQMTRATNNDKDGAKKDLDKLREKANSAAMNESNKDTDKSKSNVSDSGLEKFFKDITKGFVISLGHAKDVTSYPARVSGYAANFPGSVPEGYCGGGRPQYSYFNFESDGPTRITEYWFYEPRGQLKSPIQGRLELMVNRFMRRGHLPQCWKHPIDLKKTSTRPGGVKSVAGLNFKVTYWNGKTEGNPISGVDYLAQDGNNLVGIRGYNYGDEASTEAATEHVVESLHRVVNDDKPMTPDLMCGGGDDFDPSNNKSNK